MSTFSAQPTCSITSSDTIVLNNILPDGSCDTITLTGSGVYDSMITANTITLDLGSTNAGTTYTIGSADIGTFTWTSPEEWVNCFPDFSKIVEMNEKYPALKIAFEKFKQMYILVEDDYVAKKGKKYVP